MDHVSKKKKDKSVCVCGEDYANNVKNYLLICQRCSDKWHHRCIEPPIPDTELIKMFDILLATHQPMISWTCLKCERRNASSDAQSTFPDPVIFDVDTESEPQVSTVPVIDLTVSPETRPKDVHTATRTAEVIDLSESPAATRPLSMTDSDVIDLTLDSPRNIPLGPEARATARIAPSTLPEIFTEAPSSQPKPDGDTFSTSREESVSEDVTPDTPRMLKQEATHSPPMQVDDDDDDVDQKPLALLFQDLKVSALLARSPPGGSPGLAWITEHFETSVHMAKWEQYVKKQDTRQPLSRRKPKTTKFLGGRTSSMAFTVIDGNQLYNS
ncbi:hypothetical protein GGX14DRAFT_591855 [Mycena pura]|uniref:PHD-type domain-containing protein n=1 Tax=Mycena pura TaxID=153505 RepID=A0AAD6VPY3_9AGAR|nr:hypothetical protein GGX14DRAFT_591855 [Mycena pura]